MIAKSLREAATHTTAVRKLLLRKSEDLVCRNLMCERVGEACVCKLSLVLERLPELTHLDVSGNKLGALPPAVAALRNLTELDVSGNRLKSLPSLAQLTALETLRVEDNPDLASVPADAPALRRVFAKGTAPTFTLPSSMTTVQLDK
ncbi:hypothetical protein ACHHYP_00922 [Achlya hypogyna]|uniref:Uncharacterized protein n=1 Tax=Achlya hypogyna TaxID=1202772 RepID=A0A1V9Z9Y8_ACHHY|nr:hypothetical protein ACHHYP_00922 [Achlya hypogyna]